MTFWAVQFFVFPNGIIHGRKFWHFQSQPTKCQQYLLPFISTCPVTVTTNTTPTHFPMCGAMLVRIQTILLEPVRTFSVGSTTYPISLTFKGVEWPLTSNDQIQEYSVCVGKGKTSPLNILNLISAYYLDLSQKFRLKEWGIFFESKAFFGWQLSEEQFGGLTLIFPIL